MDFMKATYPTAVHDKSFFSKRKKKKDYEAKLAMVFLENWRNYY